MAVNTTIGYSTTFGRGNADGPPETFTTIADVVALGNVSVSVDTIDGTSFGSTAAYREFIAGLIDAGEFSVTLNFDADGTAWSNAVTDIEARAAKNYLITWPDTTTFTFAGIPTGYDIETPLDDKMTITFNYKLTGQPTIA